MKKPFAIIAVTIAVSTLVACGGSTDTAAVAPAPPATPSYENLSSVAAVTSQLGGTALRINGTTGAMAVITNSGSLNHATQKHIFTDGSITLTDNNGFDASTPSKMVDVNNAALILESETTAANGITGTYEYVRMYETAYIDPVSGDAFDHVGQFGVITSAADVALATGSATYNGGAAGLLFSNGAQNLNIDIVGDSEVAVNFAAGTVTANVTNISAMASGTQTQVATPLDTITVTGMTITAAGNRFSGGIITTTGNVTNANITGANTVQETQGIFYGFDATNSRPDEIGGMILESGADGHIVTTFIAD